MRCLVPLIRTDVSEERSAPIIIVNVVPSSPILVTLIMEVIYSSETLVLTRATRRNIPEDGILQGEVVLLTDIQAGVGNRN
jgi:hypothetical protein